MKKKSSDRKIENLGFFILKHLIQALVFYYLIFLLFDILSKGILSNFFKASLIIIGLIFLTILAILKSSRAPQKKYNPKILKIILILGFIATWATFFYHDKLLAVFIPILTLSIFLINRKALLS
ncbi:MAG: hypothetical protein GF347_05125 [Candidatus Moranbacteria bacterium]|nr:hypothetical protein [Candidatus Moranbacteria bacterium]